MPPFPARQEETDGPPPLVGGGPCPSVICGSGISRRRRPPVEHLPHLPPQRLVGHRLRKEAPPPRQDPVLQHHVVGVPAEVEDFHPRHQRGGAGGELPAIHLRHHHVG